jgi:hypothetical protein
MWKPLLKYGGTFLLGFICALIIVVIVIRWGIHKLFVSREGFQGANATGGESPATCAMMKLIIEKAQANLQKAKELADTESIKKLQISLDSIEAEMKTTGC